MNFFLNIRGKKLKSLTAFIFWNTVLFCNKTIFSEKFKWIWLWDKQLIYICIEIFITFYKSFYRIYKRVELKRKSMSHEYLFFFYDVKHPLAMEKGEILLKAETRTPIIWHLEGSPEKVKGILFFLFLGYFFLCIIAFRYFLWFHIFYLINNMYVCIHIILYLYAKI